MRPLRGRGPVVRPERLAAVVELVARGVDEVARLTERHPLPWTVVRDRSDGHLVARVRDARGAWVCSAVGEGAALVVELGALAVGGFCEVRNQG